MKIVFRPLESIAETQPQVQPALLRLSAMISQYFTAVCADYATQYEMTAPAILWRTPRITKLTGIFTTLPPVTLNRHCRTAAIAA